MIYGITSDGIVFGGLGLPSGSAGAVAVQNVIRTSGSGFAFIGYDTYSPNNIVMANNTLYDNEAGFFFKPDAAGYHNIRIYNNLVSNSNVSMQAEDISNLGAVTSQHNYFHAGGTHARLNYVTYSLSQWQSTLGKDNNSPAARSGDPLFVSASGGDFRLQSNSPARTGGVDIADLNGNGSTTDGIVMGAYITGSEVIGAGGAVVRIAAPTGGGARGAGRGPDRQPVGRAESPA